MENKEVLNISEAGNYLNCSVSKLRKMIYNNEISYFQIGNRYCFRKSNLDDWITSRSKNINI